MEDEQTDMDQVKVSTRTVYEVVANTDSIEGRGAGVVIGRTLSPSIANSIAKGQGVFGTDAEVRITYQRVVTVGQDENQECYILGPPITLKYVDKEKLRKDALSKLTDEEKSALGLT